MKSITNIINCGYLVCDCGMIVTQGSVCVCMDDSFVGLFGEDRGEDAFS